MQTSAPQFRGVLNSICEILPKLLIDRAESSSLCEIYGETGEHIGKFHRLNIKTYGCIESTEDASQFVRKKWMERTKSSSSSSTETSSSDRFFIACNLTASTFTRNVSWTVYDYMVCYSQRFEHAFSSEISAINFLNHVAEFIEPGGYLFGYCLDSSHVWNMVQKEMTRSKITVNSKSNSLTLNKKMRYSLKISNIDSNGNFMKFGTSYSLHVEGEKDHRSGCMIHFSSFLNLAKNAGFRVVSTDNMLQFYDDYKHIYHEIFHGYQVYKKFTSIQPSDSSLINMFCIFILQKEHPSDHNSNNNAPLPI